MEDRFATVGHSVPRMHPSLDGPPLTSSTASRQRQTRYVGDTGYDLVERQRWQRTCDKRNIINEMTRSILARLRRFHLVKQGVNERSEVAL